jgi:RNA polymerase sigma-70 factor (ECF subfamily)
VINTAPPDHFEEIVSLHYEALYKFAFSLARAEADACDLTQQTFYIWATKGHQLHDRSKVKSWLFTTLHREFLNLHNKAVRFPHFELSDAIEDLPAISPEVVNVLDAARVVELLVQVQEPYRSALTLFYLEDYSYKEIADILEVPLGTVRSRISRGLVQLQRSILTGPGAIAKFGNTSHSTPNNPSDESETEPDKSWQRVQAVPGFDPKH